MQKLFFVKMHGLGNDFVIMLEDKIPTTIGIGDFTSRISDRRCGIGCDQFITYKIINNNKVKMGIYNQDGSKALACGNASRCLSKMLFDTKGIRQVKLDVDGQLVSCECMGPNEIKVDMGPVSFEKQWMPNSAKLWDLASLHLIEPKEMICVDLANPHLVIFSKLSHQDQKIIGKRFQKLKFFLDGVNVNFAKVKNNRIYLKVWERGAGFTHACGSGAIATFAAANKLGFVDDNSEIVFKLGVLKMQKLGQNISMCGTASYVFSGEYLYE